jgi:hypothetical protein
MAAYLINHLHKPAVVPITSAMITYNAMAIDELSLTQAFEPG